MCSTIWPTSPVYSQEIPALEFPLHTLVELTPKPDGKMSENHIKFDVKNKRHAEVRPATHPVVRFTAAEKAWPLRKGLLWTGGTKLSVPLVRLPAAGGRCLHVR